MKIIIAGTRTFTDYSFFLENMGRIDFPITTIISGGSKGPDKMGERYARERLIPCVIYHPHWDMYHKAAGLYRNIEMAEVADGLIAFWDGKSRGTKHMIETMEQKPDVIVRVVPLLASSDSKILCRLRTKEAGILIGTIELNALPKVNELLIVRYGLYDKSYKVLEVQELHSEPNTYNMFVELSNG